MRMAYFFKAFGLTFLGCEAFDIWYNLFGRGKPDNLGHGFWVSLIIAFIVALFLHWIDGVFKRDEAIEAKKKERETETETEIPKSDGEKTVLERLMETEEGDRPKKDVIQ